MRKLKEVLRLRFGLGLRQDQIARSCSISQATVHRYLQRATAAGLGWPLPAGIDDRQLNELLFPAAPKHPRPQRRQEVDFAEVHRQLKAHKHLTLQLLREEYRETHPDDQDVVLRQEHRAGETVPIYSNAGGEASPASTFVAVLGASTYPCACAALSQDLANWIDCHIQAFEFFQGTTKLR